MLNFVANIIVLSGVATFRGSFLLELYSYFVSLTKNEVIDVSFNLSSQNQALTDVMWLLNFEFC